MSDDAQTFSVIGAVVLTFLALLLWFGDIRNERRITFLQDCIAAKVSPAECKMAAE